MEEQRTDLLHLAFVRSLLAGDSSRCHFLLVILSRQSYIRDIANKLHHRLQEETAKVEEHLLDTRDGEPPFIVSIVRCVTISKANAFENLLEPLQKILRLSPATAATLARPDMFERIGQKLHHTKPAVRVNLLRILTTICDASEERCGLLRKYGLLDALRELQKDTRILVRELAGQLVKSSEESPPLSSGRPRRSTIRRTSGNGPPPGLISSHSMPVAPQVGRSGSSKPYLDSRETPRRSNGVNSPLGLRPGSREGRNSALVPGSQAVAAMKPRLSHRLSQQISPPTQEKEDLRTPAAGRPTSLLERRRRPASAASDWS